jgi:ribosomal protein S12 methylthiotransferase accessory factor
VKRTDNRTTDAARNSVTWIVDFERALSTPTAKLHRGGTHRTIDPGATLERVRPYLPSMGITRIANVTGLDYIGVPVVMVTRPNSRALAVSQGKGVDLHHAKASGVMEAIETYHGERIDRPLKLASFAEMRKAHAVVDPATLPQPPNSRYRDHLRLLWIEGYELVGREPIWLPYECVHVDYTLPLPEGTGCFAATSNGLASGNHLLEAISSGICEVVERDADALWEVMTEPQAADRRVDLGSIKDADARQVLEKYDAARIAVELWDTTSDVGIPAFRCHIFEREDNPHQPQGIFFGAGCHPSRRIALLRALTEAAQSRLTYISGSRDDIERRDYRRPGDLRPAERLRDLSAGAPASRSYAAAPSHEAELLNDDLDWEIDRLRNIGIDRVVVVDLTDSRIGVPVVKVAIPGLESVPEDPSYVPGPRARAKLGRP